MTTSARRLALAQRRDDVLDAGLGGELDRRAGEPEPLGAQPHLRRPPPRRRYRRRAGPARPSAAQAWISSVDLPMPGSPPISSTEPRHEAAAGDAVEFGDAGGEARRLAGCRPAGPRARRRGPCAARGRGARRRCRTAARLLDDACSIRRRRRTCPASGWRPRRSSGRRRRCARLAISPPMIVALHSAGRGWSGFRSRSCRRAAPTSSIVMSSPISVDQVAAPRRRRRARR